MSENAAFGIDNDLASQLNKERRILERKKEAKRIIALEAMQMAEKRRIREKEVEACENQIASIFSDGNNINEIKKQHEDVVVRAKQRFHNNAMADIKNTYVIEDETIERTVDEFQAKLKFKDQAKVEEKRRLKQIQIKNHLDDLARDKLRKQRQKNEMKRDIENRICNEEVNFEFDRQKRLETMNGVKEHRRIMELMGEQNQKDREINYSDLLIIEKNRPFLKIDEYQHTNNANLKKLIYGVEELKAMRPHK